APSSTRWRRPTPSASWTASGSGPRRSRRSTRRSWTATSAAPRSPPPRSSPRSSATGSCTGWTASSRPTASRRTSGTSRRSTRRASGRTGRRTCTASRSRRSATPREKRCRAAGGAPLPAARLQDPRHERLGRRQRARRDRPARRPAGLLRGQVERRPRARRSARDGRAREAAAPPSCRRGVARVAPRARTARDLVRRDRRARGEAPAGKRRAILKIDRGALSPNGRARQNGGFLARARRPSEAGETRSLENMNITQARFTTQLRTWVLIAGLTGLLIAIGALLGGSFIYLFVVFAVLMNVFGYWFSDKIALAASRAKPVSEEEAPDLYRILRDLTQLAELPMPRVYLIPSEQPNAFATGRNASHAAVAVTEGLLRYLPQDQVRGVLAHELGHVKNRDILVTTIAAMVAAAISAIANILQFSFLFGGFSSDDEENPLGFIGLLATIILAPLAAMLLQLAVSRQREYLADATAARLMGTGRPLAEALETLEKGVQAVPMAVNPATASLYIVHPFRGQGIQNLFSTHPPLGERIRRLREYDA